MRVSLRPATVADIPECGRICYEAFSTVATQHGFPVDWNSDEVAIKVIASRVAHQRSYGVVAEVDGRIVGSAFLKDHPPVGAIGPVTVSPRLQGGEVGRRMMEHLIEKAALIGLKGTRLVQAAYNMQSLALYTKLGFEARELLVCLHGEPIATRIRGHAVRQARETDIPACNALCHRFHGYTRADDLAEALHLRILDVTIRNGSITGYSTGAHFRGHTIAETNADAKAMIAAAESMPPPGMLMPAANGDLLRWALGNGLRITQTLTLMTMGFYQESGGVFLPSIHA